MINAHSLLWPPHSSAQTHTHAGTPTLTHANPHLPLPSSPLPPDPHTLPNYPIPCPSTNCTSLALFVMRPESNHEQTRFYPLLPNFRFTQKNDLVDQLQPSLTFEKHQPGSTKELSRPTTPSMSSDADDGTALSSMGAAASVPESRNKAMLRDEFAVNMQKFHTSVTRTIQQIEGGTCMGFSSFEFTSLGHAGMG